MHTAPPPTPYDDGSRLEPQPWRTSISERDAYGRVDFDDDESATLFTAYAERSSDDGYVLAIDLLGDVDLRVTVGGVPLILGHAPF